MSMNMKKMRRRSITIAAVALLGLALLGLPGAAALTQSQTQAQTQTPGQQPYGYHHQMPMQMHRLGERALEAETGAETEPPLLKLFLGALAEELGVSPEQLREAIRAAKDKVIRHRLEEAVRAGQLTYEQARRLEERLTRAGPRELAKLMLWHRWREMRARWAEPLEELKAKLWERKREWKQRREWYRPLPPLPAPPYWGYYNCVCYCAFPPPYYMPPQPLPRLEPEELPELKPKPKPWKERQEERDREWDWNWNWNRDQDQE